MQLDAQSMFGGKKNDWRLCNEQAKVEGKEVVPAAVGMAATQ